MRKKPLIHCIRKVAIDGETLERMSQHELEQNIMDYSVFARVSPEHKVRIVKAFQSTGAVVAMTGDGVNDAPVITLANVGIAMGALGSDAAIEAADVVLMDDSVSKISLAIAASKRILFVANENIYGAIAIKVLALIFGALGIANMWWAIFADTGVAMLCVLNSLRLLHIARKK